MSLDINSVGYSFWSIFISELGDKTFMLLFALSQKNSAFPLLLGNMLAMIPLIISSAYIGNLFKFLPLFYLYLVASLLFLLLSMLCLLESYREYQKSKKKSGKTMKMDKYESLLKHDSTTLLVLNIAVYVFCMEITDSSQLAMFSISVLYDPVGIIIGSILAHFICSILAVAAGKVIAKYVSEVFTQLIVGVFFLWLTGYWTYLTIEEGIVYFS